MVDLTKGNPAGRMVKFALPVALGNVFQLFYSLADARIVGSTLGAEALAAVGATTSISTLLIGFMNGLTNGFAILIAQKFGAGEKNEVRRFGALSFGLGILFSILLSLVSIAGLSGIFKLLNVPDILAADARAYIAVILAGIPAAMAYNGCAGILRAVGDTGAPLAFLVLASLLNVGLDLLFILRFHMGVGGAAWATVLSQTISAVLSFCYMWKTYPFFRFHLADFAPDKNRIRQLLSSGLSMALMMSLVFFGTLALQSAINTFGTNTIVAHTGARKITEFFMLPFSVMSVTMATYCGQNLGAEETGRIRQGVRYALFLTWGWSLFVIFLSYTAAPSLIYLVTGSRETEVVTTAALYLKIDTLFYFAPAAIAVLRNALQGIGDHVTPIVSSFVELAGKTAVAFFLAPALEYMGIIMAEPIVWILMVIPLAVRYLRHPALKKALKNNKTPVRRFLFMNQTIETILTRRSTRKFLEKPIPEADLKLIVEAALCAPSGKNGQTWKFTVVESRQMIEKLSRAIEVTLGRTGYDMYRPQTIIIPSNKRDSAYGKEDNACALENIFLAAHSLGIGSVWINQLQNICDEPLIRQVLEELAIPSDHVVYGLAALGYSDGEPKEIKRVGEVAYIK